MKPLTPISADQVSVADLRAGDWLALHIFYTGNSNPLLAECVEPLVVRLREQRLIERYFFIRYWLEGPHIRLRLRPSSEQAAAQVRAQAEQAIDEFLARRPAVYELDLGQSGDVYKELFIAEYSEEQWNERYGPDGEMRLQPNNSYAYIEYVPEYDRYGGPAGIELAEWHFEKSSDMVLRLVTTTNIHIRSVMFGLSIQLLLVMSMTFLPDREVLAEFVDGYREYWESNFGGSGTVGPTRHDIYDRAYEEMAPALCARVQSLYEAVTGENEDRLSGFVQEWAAHCRELRQRALRLIERGELVFQTWDEALVRKPASDAIFTLRVLLSSYVHMTDNRLGLTLQDEIYLSYMLHRAIQDCLLTTVTA